MSGMLGAFSDWAVGQLGDGPGRMSVRAGGRRDLGAWRAAARERVRELLAEPAAAAADVRVERRASVGGLDVELLSWQLPWGPRTEACLLKPSGATGRLPGLLALHDHGGFKYLGWRKAAYVSKFRFPPDQALAMIREAQGIPVLAHPFTLNQGSAYALRNLVVELQGQGLAGLEVFYSEHTPEQIALYLKLARELGLLITGGSDFHGLNKPEITLGSMPCQDRLTYDLVTALKAWRQREYGLEG